MVRAASVVLAASSLVLKWQIVSSRRNRAPIGVSSAWTSECQTS